MSFPLSSLSAWDWLDISGLLMVLAGVVGGFKARRGKYRYVPNPADPRPLDVREKDWEIGRERREDIWEYVLIIGLALEFLALPRHISEAARLLKQSEEIRATNLVLQIRLNRIGNRVTPRVALVGKLVENLEGKPSGWAEILYQEGDGEVWDFAGWLKSVLLHAKWNIEEPRPIGDTVSGSYSGMISSMRQFPPPMRLGAAPNGVTIIANRKTMDTIRDKKLAALTALLKALAD